MRMSIGYLEPLVSTKLPSRKYTELALTADSSLSNGNHMKLEVEYCFVCE